MQQFSASLSVLLRFYFPQWKLHLFELEEEMKINPPIKYVLYQVIMHIHFFAYKFLPLSTNLFLKSSDDTYLGYNTLLLFPSIIIRAIVPFHYH